VKTFNIKALFKIGGRVVEKILVEEIGVRVKMRAEER
jgi:hypothetical protein